MKVNLSVFAIVLSCLALAVSLAQSFNALPKAPPPPPSFDISDFEINETYTQMRIYNNGTDMAYNIRVLVIYESPDPTSPLRQLAFPLTVYIPELAPGEYRFTQILVPIGKMQLRTQTQNISEYVADVWISCRNFQPGLHFSFNVAE